MGVCVFLGVMKSNVGLFSPVKGGWGACFFSEGCRVM